MLSINIIVFDLGISTSFARKLEFITFFKESLPQEFVQVTVV